MKAVGIIQCVGEEGRVVIPKGIRDLYEWKRGQRLEVFVGDGETVILKAFRPVCTCIFCDSATEDEFRGKRVCVACREELKS